MLNITALLPSLVFSELSNPQRVQACLGIVGVWKAHLLWVRQVLSQLFLSAMR